MDNLRSELVDEPRGAGVQENRAEENSAQQRHSSINRQKYRDRAIRRNEICGASTPSMLNDACVGCQASNSWSAFVWCASA